MTFPGLGYGQNYPQQQPGYGYGYPQQQQGYNYGYAYPQQQQGYPRQQAFSQQPGGDTNAILGAILQPLIGLLGSVLIGGRLGSTPAETQQSTDTGNSQETGDSQETESGEAPEVTSESALKMLEENSSDFDLNDNGVISRSELEKIAESEDADADVVATAQFLTSEEGKETYDLISEESGEESGIQIDGLEDVDLDSLDSSDETDESNNDDKNADITGESALKKLQDSPSDFDLNDDGDITKGELEKVAKDEEADEDVRATAKFLTSSKGKEAYDAINKESGDGAGIQVDGLDDVDADSLETSDSDEVDNDDDDEVNNEDDDDEVNNDDDDGGDDEMELSSDDVLSTLKENRFDFDDNNDDKITRAELRKVANDDDADEDVRKTAEFLTSTEGREAYDALVSETGGSDGINTNNLDDVNPNSLPGGDDFSSKGDADNVDSSQDALTALEDEDLQKMLDETNADGVTDSSRKDDQYDKAALKALAEGKGEFGDNDKVTQEQRDAAAYILDSENSALEESLDIQGGNLNDDVYKTDAVSGLLDESDATGAIDDGELPDHLKPTDVKGAAGILKDDSLKAKLHEASDDDALADDVFNRKALQELADGEGSFSTATLQQKAAAQYFLDNSDAENTLDNQAGGQNDDAYIFGSFGALSA